MKLPASLTTVTPLSKALALLTFIVFICCFFFLGVFYERSQALLDSKINYLTIVTPTPKNDQCGSIKLNGTVRSDDEWVGSLRSERGDVYYVETNPSEKIICEFEIYSAKDQPDYNDSDGTHSIDASHLTSSNLYRATFIDRSYQSTKYVTIDIPTSTILSAVPIGSAADFIVDHYAESYTMIQPVTLIAGCTNEDPGSCEALSEAVAQDWARDDVYIYVVNIAGGFIQFPRSTLPKASYSMNYDYDNRSIIISSTKTTYEPLRTIPFDDFKSPK